MSIISLPPTLVTPNRTAEASPANRQEQLEKVSEQFEALFLQQILKQMRKASDVLSAENSPMRSRALDTMRDYHDQLLADSLSSKRQTGISDMLVKQLSGNQGGRGDPQIGLAGATGELPRATVASLAPLRATWQRGSELVSSAWKKGSAEVSSLLDSLISQESSGNPEAVSPKGARGLMQLMPDTAREMAAELGVPYSKERLTQDSAYNKRLGTAYLSKMLARYDGHPALALAAYNAGPGKVDEWLQVNGDPRQGQIETKEWIERIPYQETRNYTHNILRDADRNSAKENSSQKVFKPEAEPVALLKDRQQIQSAGANQLRSAAFAQPIRTETQGDFL